MRWWLPVKSGYLLFDKVHNSAYEYSHSIVLVMLLAVAVLIHLCLTESVELVSNICEYNVNFHFMSLLLCVDNAGVKNGLHDFCYVIEHWRRQNF